MKSHEFDDLLQQILAGKAIPPNLAEVAEPDEALQKIARMRGLAHRPYGVKLTDNEQARAWYPWVFTDKAGMSDRFNGNGAILTSGGKVYTFHMCDHVWDETGANHSRGWHPARCKNCGFDASIDSGD